MATASSRTRTANRLTSPTTAPFKDGRRQQDGLNLSGGSQQVQYYLSGEWEPKMECSLAQRTQDATLKFRSETPSYVTNPNSVGRASMRANLMALLGETGTVSVFTGYVSSTVRLPQTTTTHWACCQAACSVAPTVRLQAGGAFILLKRSSSSTAARRSNGSPTQLARRGSQIPGWRDVRRGRRFRSEGRCPIPGYWNRSQLGYAYARKPDVGQDQHLFIYRRRGSHGAAPAQRSTIVQDLRWFSVFPQQP